MSGVLRVPQRFQDADLKKVDKKTFSMVFDYLKDFEKNVKGGVGLLLSGSYGIGKTYSLCALTREAEKRVQAKQKYMDYVVVSAPDFFDRIPIFEDRTILDERRNQSWFTTYTRVPWLVIDDLGKELRTAGFQEQVVSKLGRVLRARNGRCLTTHISTNLPLLAGKDYDSLHSVYADGVMSLLSEMVRSYTVTGPDRRRKR